MKTFTTTLLATTAIALVATATPLNHATPSHGSGSGAPNWYGSHNNHNHGHNHTTNGTSTIRMTITKTRTSTITVEPTPYNSTFVLSASAVATSEISASYTPVDIASAVPSSVESGDAGLAAATGLW
ncbi:hypothetical protein GMOD_00003765 [Pyrenophora seminiperda CCB06]|uniref:Uncharacterized protein n=1 Tax=Pyrenophora seminiperda CCB06 TaxID=1302712 RepID=A0A3M7MKE9_9PLEO|nr:hypothetical protein GMOD_00003765 [Pyrenophora seminiperda CCB06]